MHPSLSRAFQRHQKHDLKHPNLVDLISTKQNKKITFLCAYIYWKPNVRIWWLFFPSLQATIFLWQKLAKMPPKKKNGGVAKVQLFYYYFFTIIWPWWGARCHSCNTWLGSIINYVEGPHCDIGTFCETIQLLVDVSLLPPSSITTFVTTWQPPSPS
jgi:hypothetical protein